MLRAASRRHWRPAGEPFRTRCRSASVRRPGRRFDGTRRVGISGTIEVQSACFSMADMGERLVDADGYRPNVGIVVANGRAEVLWARRVGGRDAWQFPQGGILDSETPEEALYRELYEEVGLEPDAVKLVARTRGWLRYRLPERLRRRDSSPSFVGQKQKWFLLRMLGDDGDVRVSHTGKPEFDAWRWVSYWYPVGQVVAFKQQVYRRALKELAPHLTV